MLNRDSCRNMWPVNARYLSGTLPSRVFVLPLSGVMCLGEFIRPKKLRCHRVAKCFSGALAREGDFISIFFFLIDWRLVVDLRNNQTRTSFNVVA